MSGRATSTRPMRACTRSSRSVSLSRATPTMSWRRWRSRHASACPCSRAGRGTSLAGQTVGRAVVLDFSRHMHRLVAIDPEARHGARAARAGAGRPEPGRRRARSVLRPRHVDVQPGHARRDDRQQLVRRPLGAVRHDDRPRRCRSTWCSSDGSRATLEPSATEPSPGGSGDTLEARLLPRGPGTRQAARGRRSAATIPPFWRKSGRVSPRAPAPGARAVQPRQPRRRIRGNARDRRRGDGQARAAAQRGRRRRRPLRDGRRGASPRSRMRAPARRRRSSWSTVHPRPRAALTGARARSSRC